MNKRLRKLLFSAALLALPFTSMKAFEWSAYGTELNIYGYATSGGLYLDSDRIWDTYEAYNSSFQATALDSTLDIYSMLYDDITGDPIAPCSLKIDGDVILDATQHDMTVNILADNDQTFETVIFPFIESYTDSTLVYPELGYSQVVFQTDVGRVITVNLEQDLVFSGSDDKELPCDMIVTFKGAGQTVFKLYDGTAIKFDGEIDYYGGLFITDEDGTTEWYGVSAEAGKTRVYVTMDQTAGEVAAGDHKVVFERANLSTEEVTHPEWNVMVYVGYNSFITYLSDNTTGIDAGSDRIHAAIGFDPSNVGTGRMVLFLKGAYFTGWEVGVDPEREPNRYWWIVEKYPLNDAAVVVAGHFVDDLDPATISHPIQGQVGVDFTTPAGGAARLDVLDNQYYNAQETKPFPYNVADSRGLLVVNDVQNHGKLGSDPYWDFWNDPDFYEGPWWSYYQDPADPLHALDLNVRRGFVAGINGIVGVYDNAFLDYTAGSINQPDAIAWYGLANVSTPTIYTPDFDHGLLKLRNPSAMIFDNIDESLFYNGGTGALVGYSTGNPFLHNPYYNNGVDAVHAQLQLYGHARAYFKDSASSYDGGYYGYIYNFWNIEEAGGNPILDQYELDWDSALAVGEPDLDGVIESSTYDGYQLSANLHTLLEGEGEHVVDVEGKMSTWSYPNVAIPGRSTGYESATLGTIAMSSVWKDYTGREIKYDFVTSDLYDVEYFNRPLLTYYLGGSDAAYVRYNSPAFFFNAHAQMFNTIIRHDDASKYVAGIPYDADPAYTGGEVLYFSNELFPEAESVVTAPDRYMLPELRYFNSTFESHESACMTGLRNVVKDIPGLRDITGLNTSVIKFFDHGDSLDSLLTKHGRIFQLSSMWNLMGDGNSNYATESAPFNVYKGNKPVYRASSDVADTSATIKLALQREGEYPTVPVGHDYSKEIAHNLFLTSIPDAVGAKCVLSLGWTPNIYPLYEDMPNPAIPADLRMMPLAEQGGYPYEALPLYDEVGAYLFALNALDEHYPASQATVSVDGDLITFGAFDQYGDSPKTPVLGYSDNGIIQVIHGGKMTITRPEGTASPVQRTSVPYQTFIDSMVLKTIWNDWNAEGTEREVWFGGVFDVPHDQVTFGRTFGVQPYGLTSEMFEARYDETGGYVRVDFNNETRTIRADKTGDEEVVFGWFQRDPNPKLSQTKGLTLVRRIDASSKLTQDLKAFLTRATESVDTPIARPDYLLYISAPDDITQMRVSGATMADPFHLDIAGNYDAAGLPKSARVREFTTQYTTNGLITQHFIGEGAHAVLFGEYGGVIGLGDRHWNENSLSAWNLLGKDYVSIAPLGDMTVELNSNLIVADRLPLIATTSFGAGDAPERLTFYSALPLEIRIPAGFELDLSAFGQSAQRQEIEFAGNVRLVLEDGASIRFPAPEKVVGGVVLYFNDDSQFIFEGLEIPGTYSTADDTNYDLIKILGKGQIWLNKNAQMLVNGDVRVGVQSDELTPNTDLTISIQRQASMHIGDANLAGGTFQVGNPTYIPGGATVNFSLLLNGAEALFETNREGFFGLGAGILNKNAGDPMNGSASAATNPMLDIYGKAQIVNGYPVFTKASDAWSVIPLYNVNNVTIQVTQGAIQHNNIYNGSNGNASMWAIGNANQYTLSLNSVAQAIVRGGGNIMVLPSTLPEDVTSFLIDIWDYAGQLVTQETYSIIDSAPTMLQRDAGVGTKSAYLNGYSFVYQTLLGGNNASVGFFNLLGFQPFSEKKYSQVCISKTLFDIMVGFVNYDVLNKMYPATYTRITRQVAAGSVKGNLPTALNFGAIDGEKTFADPTLFTSNWPVY